ncbi:MAG: purine-binding chemotaxis protein CheW [Actinobacteria bacterium]|nr:purine-binding chemotaxis protein CheW [Actinomycetota bacterium]
MEKLKDVTRAISTGAGDQFVTFALDNEKYGVEVLKVQEIIGYQGFAKVPNVPPFVKGVLNLRGSVVPVVDLRLKLNMKPREYDNFTVILIMEVRERVVGIIVDAVSDVVNLSPEDIQQTPDFSSGIRVDFIKGMGRKDEELIIILDIDRVLSSNELQLSEIA